VKLLSIAVLLKLYRKLPLLLVIRTILQIPTRSLPGRSTFFIMGPVSRRGFRPSAPSPLTRAAYRVIILTCEGVPLFCAVKENRTRCCTMNFEDLIAKVKTCGKQKLAVAAAEDDAVLEAVDAAHKQGIADAILVGDEAAIRKIAAELNIDLTDYEIIHEPDTTQASLTAVKLADDGVADMCMKGLAVVSQL